MTVIVLVKGCTSGGVNIVSRFGLAVRALCCAHSRKCSSDETISRGSLRAKRLHSHVKDLVVRVTVWRIMETLK